MAEFAVPTDVGLAYEGSLPSTDKLQYLLDIVSARLRLLMPSLATRITAAGTDSDLAVAAKDVVVQAVIRRLPGQPQHVESQTQTTGPYSTTLRFTKDISGTFTDDDLDLLSGVPSSTGVGVGTIRVGRPDWSAQ